MPLDYKECRELAKRSLKLADEITDPVLKNSLEETAWRWERLAECMEANSDQGGTKLDSDGTATLSGSSACAPQQA